MGKEVAEEEEGEGEKKETSHQINFSASELEMHKKNAALIQKYNCPESVDLFTAIAG